ncbi:hypothetical protein LTR85_007818 [Meristemomyces frigidus]|nr:hypothetical protein LTR85_007818 [Meristemomyces frigidus]
MDHDRLLNAWLTNSSQVESGTRFIVLQASGTELAGYVSLYMKPSETGPFRSSVEKLMFSSRHRRRGVAWRVMGLLEAVAKEGGGAFLVLDTMVGLGAVSVYPRLS